MLVVVLAAASVYGITSFQNVVNIAVHEPVTWTPLTTNIQAFTGSSNSYTLQICNEAASLIVVTFQPSVSLVPVGGLASDITFNATVNSITKPVTPPIPIPLPVGPGVFDGSQPPACVNVRVNFAIAPGAVAGTYAVTNTVTKI